MKRNYIKLPDGRLVKPQASKLERYLRTQSQPAVRATTAPGASPSERDDNPADPDMQCLYGHEIILFGAGFCR